MKLFYVDPQSYNNLADYDKNLLNNISNDIDILFVCSSKFYNQFTREIVINRLYNYNSYSRLIKIFSYIKSQIKLYINIKKENPDFIHFQWFKIPIFDFLLLKCIKKHCKKTKIVFTAHNVLPHDSGSKYKAIYKKIYHTVDKIIVHVNSTKIEIAKDFSINYKKIEVIPHGFLPCKSINFKRNQNDKFRFSFIGSLSDYKGLDILLDAWINTSSLINNSSIELLIAGAGNLPCLKKIPNDKNIVLENYFHTDEELSTIIKSTDLALLPYKKISQSGVLLSFLAERVPVLVSNIGGLTQAMHVAPVGWILPELSSDAISTELEKITSNPKQIELVKNNKEYWKAIKDFYSWEKIGHKTTLLYLDSK